MNFSGRVALITGGTRGIGLAIGRRLSDADARIAILARDPERLAVVDHKLGRSDDAVVGLRADVTDPAQVQEAVAAVLDRWGRIDILVNNAGDVGRTVPTWELSDADWLGTLAVNLTGTFYCLRAVLPVMRAQRYGRIVNVASIVGKEGAGKLAAYSAAKAGMIGLTKAVAKEVAPDGILVNCIYSDVDSHRNDRAAQRRDCPVFADQDSPEPRGGTGRSGGARRLAGVGRMQLLDRRRL